MTVSAALAALIAAAPCLAASAQPDRVLTPGSVRASRPHAVCGHARESRHRVTPDRADEVLRRYGLSIGVHPGYEIDHLIPLGGAREASRIAAGADSSASWEAHKFCRVA